MRTQAIEVTSQRLRKLLNRCKMIKDKIFNFGKELETMKDTVNLKKNQKIL